MGGILPGSPLSPAPPGHTSPPRCSTQRGSPTVTLPGGPAGAGEGLSPAAPSQGCGICWGTQVPRDAWSQVEGSLQGRVDGTAWLSHLPLGAASPGACPGSGAGSCSAGRAWGVSGHPQWLSLCTTQATHRLPTSPCPCSLSACLAPVAPVPCGAGLHMPGGGRLHRLCYMAPGAPSSP